MMTIWKAILEATEEQEIEVPAYAEFLTASEQMGALCVWYRCNPALPKGKRRISIRGTGHDAPPPEVARYLGSGFIDGGQIVLHVFVHVS